jgi:predicted homoserine dehydrogenase-like protein
MYGPALKHVNESSVYFRDKLGKDGIVDFLVGAEPANGAFVLGYTEEPIKARYLKYLKMGDGPLYTFYTPFHLPQLEAPLTVAKAVLCGDATIAPQGPPACDAISVAKQDLKAGTVLDGIGGFTCYALVENYHDAHRGNALPIGVAAGCTLKNTVGKDSLLTYDDVELPMGRLCDQLRDEQDQRFVGSTRRVPQASGATADRSPAG